MSPLKISQEDIAPFADLGTGVEAIGSGFRLKRNGADLKVEARETGYVVTTFDQAEKFFPNSSSLLSSAIFADLTKIARNQAVILATQRIEGSPIPVTANMKSVRGEVPEFISNGKPWGSARQMVD